MRCWLLMLFCFALPAIGQESELLQIDDNARYSVPEPEWGIAIGTRRAEIPFKTKDNKVSDFVPKLYYEGEVVFLRGDNGGVRFYQQNKHSTSAIGVFRFFDIPAEYQNKLQGAGIDLGLQYQYLITPHFPFQLELLSDNKGNAYVNNRVSYQLDLGDFDVDFSTTLRYKSSDFNNRYYGLTVDNIGAGFDANVGVKARYHVWSNFYLLGEASLMRLGNEAYHSRLIDSPTQSELYFGIAFFNDKKDPGMLTLPENHYLRWAFGWATPSNISEIIRFNSEKDEYNNRLTSVFYGYPLAESLLTLPIETFLTGGIAYHLESDVQDPIAEFVTAIKFYYTFTWPARWRFGFAEGLSYVTDLTYIERIEMEEKGYEESNLLNYLDFSLDLNLGDVFQSKSMDKLWLGYSIHHRSAIFESSSMFGRIKGGSNYNTVYLQWHF